MIIIHAYMCVFCVFFHFLVFSFITPKYYTSLPFATSGRKLSIISGSYRLYPNRGDIYRVNYQNRK